MTELINLEHLIDQAQELEPLPASICKLSGLIAEDEPDFKKIVEIIEFDQALTARLLASANSAASASRQPVATVRAAVIRLGMGAVLSLAVAAAMRGRMGVSVDAYDMTEGALWRHSVCSAIVAECLANENRENIPSESFTAALLHDLGKLLLGRQLRPEITTYLERAEQEGEQSRVDAELELLGVHHGEVGGLIAQFWKLPPSIVKGIMFHHDPGPGDSIVCDAVHVSNQLAKFVETHDDSWGEEPMDPSATVVPGSLDRLGLGAEALERLIVAGSRRFEEVGGQYFS